MANTFRTDYYSTLEEEYHIPHSILGPATSPQTANQLSEATQRLNAGVKNIELAPISQEVFEAIPKEHFKEINRLTKLVDAKPSLHAPIHDLAGFGREKWSEHQRLQNEMQILNSIDRAYDLDPQGSTPVTVHSSGGVPAFVWQKITKEGKEVPLPGEKYTPAEGIRMMTVVNQESGQIQPLEYEEKRYIGREKIWTPMERLENLNETQWDQEKLQLLELQKRKREVQDRLVNIELQNSYLEWGAKNDVLSDEERAVYEKNKREINLLSEHIHEINHHVMTGVNEINHKFEKFAPEERKEEIKSELNGFNQVIDKFTEQDRVKREIIEKYGEKIAEGILRPEDIPKVRKMISDEMRNRFGKDVIDQDDLLSAVSQLPAPEVWKPLNKFAIEKSSDTVANSAFYAYGKYGENAPTLLVENVYPEWAIGRAESLKEAIEESRGKFSNILVKERGLSENEAKKISEKLIGATWDVGHINLLRKFGYSEEDIVEETKKIAKYVKHLHLTDNFGFSDIHLPPGMGNVPMKKIWEELKKAGFKERGIVEAGGYVQHFKTSPHPATLAALNSPLYSIKALPYWSEIVDTYGVYGMGYGEMLPTEHFKMYGTGFAGLPRELGGQVSEDRSRFAGTPNQ